jgi:hypothetical protein
MRHVGDESVESVEKGDRRDFEDTSELDDWPWPATFAMNVIVVAFASLQVQHGRYC